MICVPSKKTQQRINGLVKAHLTIGLKHIFFLYIHLSIWSFDASFIRLNDYATSFSIQTPKFDLTVK